MRISVVVPHYNQPEYLQICLDTLKAQTPVSADVEIIVVDNNSIETPEHVCADFPDVTLLRETTPGPGPARNKGVSHASGEILAFIDADCHAHREWLAAIERVFDNPETQVVGGDVRVNILNPNKPTFLEAYERIYAYRNEKYIAKGFSGTGNLAMRREVYDRVGAFAGIGVAEDRDWGQRARASGYRIIYVADMIVYHPARTQFSKLVQKWDRHILHEYQEMPTGMGRMPKWYAKAVALAVSPLVEVLRIATTSRISGLRMRFQAFYCLVMIRLYRSYAMIRLGSFGAQRQARNDWTRS
ncbi:glycosyltransferase [Ruegeria arenilitoris]|uniref:glycosyltransferase n=1 Tax=Ruegeria arenilitoris TaxID=1173585 RepID=UPI00147C04F4|nr:glycosyltransferase [Ruegeria arenilitoris]